MSLATRCAACGTVFRVVQDQLKVSEGWVRCGRCGDVFSALEGLFDLERETAPAWTPSQRGALDLLPAQGDERAAAASAPVPLAPATTTEPTPSTPSDWADAASANDTHADTHADSHIETRLMERDELDSTGVGRGELSDLDDEAQSEARDDDGVGEAPVPAETPAFLRRAKATARWQHPRMRMALAATATLLSLALAAQIALWQRDEMAARWPQSLPWLNAACATLGCRVEPWRRLDGLAVESSGLTQLDNASQYRLQVALRNRDAWPLLTPALDVTLTDNRGEVVARKVLRQSDFGKTIPSTLGAGAELTLQAVFDAGDRRISGYSVEVFYP